MTCGDICAAPATRTHPSSGSSLSLTATLHQAHLHSGACRCCTSFISFKKRELKTYNISFPFLIRCNIYSVGHKFYGSQGSHRVKPPAHQCIIDPAERTAQNSAVMTNLQQHRHPFMLPSPCSNVYSENANAELAKETACHIKANSDCGLRRHTYRTQGMQPPLSPGQRGGGRAKAQELKSLRGCRDNLMQMHHIWAECNLGAFWSELGRRGLHR